MKKTIPALAAAFLITAFLAACMLLIGQDVLSTSSAAAAPAISASAASQIQQVLIQYQLRDAQYQGQINSAAAQITAANQQIQQANLQIQQYQSILTQLQERGLITIASDGTISIH